MRRLPLYPTLAKPPVSQTPPRAANPKCTSCALGGHARKVCQPGFVTGGKVRPGGVLVVLPQPLVQEDAPGTQAVYGAGGRYVQSIVQRALGPDTPVAWTFAVRCAAPGGTLSRNDPRAAAALKGCRGYLAEEIGRLRPSRILCIGTLAATAVFGDEVPHAMMLRRGYGWIGSSPETATPVFILDDAADILTHRTLRPEYTEDVTWALGARVGEEIYPPAWTATFREVETAEDAVAVVADLRAALANGGVLTFDVETASKVGLWSDDFKVLTLSFTPGDDASGSVAWGRAACADPEIMRPALELLSDPEVPKAGANVKYDCNAILSAYGVAVRGIVSDTRLESRLYDPDMDATLGAMNWSVGMGGAKTEAAVAVKKATAAINKAVKAEAAAKARGQGSLFGEEHAPVIPAAGAKAGVLAYGMLPEELRVRYCVRDTVGCARNVARLAVRRRGPGPYLAGAARVWDTLVRDATEVFSRVESRGFPIDKAALYDCAEKVADRIEEEREAIREAFPGLNPDKDGEVYSLLYDELALTTTVLTDSDRFAVSAAALAENVDAHPGIAHLARYSALTHLRGTYLDGMPAPGERFGTTGLLRHIRRDGRVHCTYNLDGARTGRLSASDPNLQNIPRAEESQANPDSIFGRLIKDMFVAPAGWRWIQLDYSQLELRVAAILTNDPVMLEIFRSGVDYHMRTAELIAPTAFGVSAEAWASLDAAARKPFRSKSKAVNFGLLYGMMEKTLAKRMGCDVATARATIKAILGKMVVLAKWMEDRRAQADRTGIICTEWAGQQGRFRPLHRMTFRGTIAVNTPVQGTASEFCLSSVVRLDRALEYEGLANDAYVFGTVHDSVLLLAREHVAHEVTALGKAVMEDYDTPVLLEADAEWGDKWGSLEKVKLAA